MLGLAAARTVERCGWKRFIQSRFALVADAHVIGDTNSNLWQLSLIKWLFRDRAAIDKTAIP
jgi:hypothetical protein